MPLTIIHNNITKMSVDAIVNATNTNLKAGGGVCGVIVGSVAWQILRLMIGL
jgi:O-acetyl-ADP-ribose deacetylase (regulator of RNase III)